jgi:hypothetical protein
MPRGLRPALVLALASSAAAARAERPAVAIDGAASASCPAPEAVAREIASLLPSRRVLLGPAEPGAVAVRVVDLGGRYLVEVGEHGAARGVERRFDDAARRCAERARAAAVFVTLALEPPALAPGDEPEPAAPAPPSATPAPASAAPGPPTATPAPPTATPAPPPTTPAPPTATPAPPIATPSQPTATPSPPRPPPSPPRRLGPLHVDLELAGAVAVAPPIGDAALAVDGGGALRLVVGAERIAASLGAGVLATRIDAGPGAALLVRVPLDLDLRAAWRRGRVELGGELGLLVTVLLVAGQRFAANAPLATRADAGLRAALFLRLFASPRLAPFLALAAEVSPRAYPLLVGDTAVGATPRLRLGALLGLAVRFR